jgi:hypothetical protein
MIELREAGYASVHYTLNFDPNFRLVFEVHVED